MTLRTHEWDGSEFIETPEGHAELLNDAIAENHPGLLRSSVGTVARAIGMTAIARLAGVPRSELYAAVHAAEDGDPAPLARIAAAARAQLEPVTEAA